MEVIFVVLPLAICMAGVALGAFFWCVHRGQMDDLDTPRYRALFDDSATEPTVAPPALTAACKGGIELTGRCPHP